MSRARSRLLFPACGRTFLVVVCLVAALEDLALNVDAARAFFVFGDSLVDNGNNNYLVTSARADRPPYGIDSSNGPTGRFSNARNIPDFISEQIGSEPLLPYLSPELTGERLLIGANFASAGVGILNDTGIQFANIIRMYRQFELFEEYQRRVSALIGPERTQQLVNGGLVLITVGGNDFVNNYYFVPFSARSRQYSLPDFVTFLISEYRKLLTRLYDLGTRRVMVTGTGPLGCVPSQLATRSRNGECSEELQRAANLFNPQLVRLLRELNTQYGADVFVASNAMMLTQSDFINNPAAFGFVTSKVACCGQGRFNGVGVCTVASNLCPNRDVYAFWDPFHPTEKANGIIVRQMMTGSTEYMDPMNISTILALDSNL